MMCEATQSWDEMAKEGTRRGIDLDGLDETRVTREQVLKPCFSIKTGEEDCAENVGPCTAGGVFTRSEREISRESGWI